MPGGLFGVGRFPISRNVECETCLRRGKLSGERGEVLPDSDRAAFCQSEELGIEGIKQLLGRIHRAFRPGFVDQSP